MKFGFLSFGLMALLCSISPTCAHLRGLSDAFGESSTQVSAEITLTPPTEDQIADYEAEQQAAWDAAIALEQEGQPQSGVDSEPNTKVLNVPESMLQEFQEKANTIESTVSRDSIFLTVAVIAESLEPLTNLWIENNTS